MASIRSRGNEGIVLFTVDTRLNHISATQGSSSGYVSYDISPTAQNTARHLEPTPMYIVVRYVLPIVVYTSEEGRFEG